MKKFSESVVGNNFKLGIDVHGVIDDLPELFSFLTNLIVSAGGEVHIITGGSWDKELENVVRQSGVKWTHHFSVYDHLISSGEKINGIHKFSDGTTQRRFSDDVWNRIKGEYCRNHDISLHIDDTLIYNDYFTTPFAKLFAKK